MSVAPQSDQRLTNYCLDQSAREKLREMASVIRPVVAIALDRAIQGAIKLPHVAAVWRRHGNDLRQLEIRQYDELLRGEFDETYLDICRQTAEREAALGFENRARMNCGAIIGNLSSSTIRTKYRWSNPTERAAILSGAIMFDLATTTTFFLELSEKAAEDRRSKIDNAIADFDITIGRVLTSIRDASLSLMRASTVFREVTTTTGNRLAAASILSSQTSSDVAHTVSATTEMSESIQGIAKEAAAGSEMAAAASSTAKNTREKMRQLDGATARIGSIVDVISKIAAQTNLLALNATIEAARAGAAGRGFAIVATEVKALANQTEQATRGVADQIAAIQSTSGIMATEITSLTNAIDSLAAASNTIAASVVQQEATTGSISETIEVASKKIAQTSGEIASVKDENGRSVSAIGELLQRTEDLSRAAKEMETQVSTFFHTVRAA